MSRSHCSKYTPTDHKANVERSSQFHWIDRRTRVETYGSGLHEFRFGLNLEKVPVNCFHITESTQITHPPLRHFWIYICTDFCRVLKEAKDGEGIDGVPAGYHVNHAIFRKYSYSASDVFPVVFVRNAFRDSMQ